MTAIAYLLVFFLEIGYAQRAGQVRGATINILCYQNVLNKDVLSTFNNIENFKRITERYLATSTPGNEINKALDNFKGIK